MSWFSLTYGATCLKSVIIDSYEWAMNLFVAGFQLNVTSFDTNIYHIALGTVSEAAAFWVLGLSVAYLYNTFNNR